MAIVATAALGVAGLAAPASAAVGPAFKVFDASVSETQSDSIVNVKIQLTSIPTERTTVDWSTVDESATAGDDYVSRQGTAVFPKGTRTKLVKVKVLADTLNEGDETFKIRLSDPVGASIQRRHAHVTISDDDLTMPSLSAEDVEVAEGDDGATDVALPVVLSEPSGRVVTVGYTVTPGTASHDSDYALMPTSGTLTFVPGDIDQEVGLSVIGDRLDERSETVNLALVAPVNAVLHQDSAVLTIKDDDGPGLKVADVSVVEGGTAVFTVSLSAASPDTVTVAYTTANGKATQPADYTAKSGTLTFDPGEKTETVSVGTVGDTIDESDETFSLVLSKPWNAAISDGEGVATIQDNDGPAVYVDDAVAQEGKDVVFSISLSAASPQTVTVAYATANGKATSPADFKATSGTLTFAPGEKTKAVAVPTVNDTALEGDEAFTLVLSNATQATIGDGQATGAIRDDDGPVLRIGDASSVAEGTNLVFTVTLSLPSAHQVRVGYATQNGTAVAPADFGATSGVLTFAPGDTSEQVLVPTVDDKTVEEDESLSVVLTDSVNASIVDNVGVTWIDGNGVMAKATDLGDIRGDVGSDTITKGSAIWYGDHDMYRVEVEEESSGTFPMSVEVNLVVPNNGGDLNLCAYDGTGSLLACRTTTGTADENFTLTWPDTDGRSDTRIFFLEVLAPPGSANGYTLNIGR